MRTKKIRGYRRLHNEIEKWRIENVAFDIQSYLQNERDRYYAKIRVAPWSGISLTNSIIPEPKGNAKQKIVAGLIDVFESWKIQLDKLGQPYYLKIWIFEPRFSQSQVVCAIGDSIDFYENAFFKPDNSKPFLLNNYGKEKTRLEKLNWDYRLDEDHYDQNEIGEPQFYASQQDYEESKKWFNNLLKKPHRTIQFKDTSGNQIESYSFKRGNLWLLG